MIVRYRGVGCRLYNPVDSFSWDECQFKIKLTPDTFDLPGNVETIEGELSFYNVQDTSSPGKYFEFTDLWIQLEGNATSNFMTTTNGDITFNEKTDKFLSADDDPNSRSLIYRFVHKGQPRGPSYFAQGKGPHFFPFQIDLTQISCLPPTYKGAYGDIWYSLNVYADFNQKYRHHIAALTTEIIFKKGRLNLTLISPRPRPIFVSKKIKSSLFSRRPTLTASLSVVEKQGFLPGEKMTCHLDVDNPMSEFIGKIKITFVQKICAFTTMRSKSTIVVLDEREFMDFDSNYFRCEAIMRIPIDTMPTFARKIKALEILYFLQFCIKLVDKLPLKGEAAVIVGSTRQLPISSVGQSALGLRCAQKSVGMTSLRESKRNSLSSNFDAMSIQSEVTLPPSYSKLSSRRSSRETLPPTYDQVDGDFKDEK